MNNKYVRKFFFYICFFPVLIYADKEIEVRLATKTALSPLYLSQISAEGSQYDPPYLAAVRAVLSFDLNQSGHFIVSKVDARRQDTVSKEDVNVALNQKFWKEQNIAYVVKLDADAHILKIWLYDVRNNRTKREPDIPLSGEITRDRLYLHGLADRITQFFTGKNGIASTKILYTMRIKNPYPTKEREWLSTVWLSDYDGYNARQVINDGGYCVSPVFIPKKARGRQPFLYVSYREGQPKIYHSFLEEKVGKSLLFLPGNQLLPSVAPQADKIAFISDAAGRPDLFIQYYNGQGRRRSKPMQLFSFPRATQASSSFSPDGRMLAFVSDKDGSPRIYVLQVPSRPTGKRPPAHLITKRNRYNVTPSWSYDGKKIAYSAKTNGIRQIWIYDFVTDEERQLTFGSQNKENPVWAPDNLHIIYNSEDQNSSELFMINLNRPKAVQISQGPGRKRFPSWEPFSQ